MARGSKSGDTFIKLSLEDSEVIKGFRRVEKRLGAIGGGLQRVGRSGVLAGAAIVGAFGAAARLFAATGDEIGKMSARTGVSAEALTGLGFAAEQTGSNLTTVEAGIRGMNRTVLNADRGLSTAIDTFDRLGVTLDDLEGKTPEEQLLLFADRLSGVEDPGERAALAMQLFGRSGQRLLPLLSLGAGGIGELTDEAQRLGLVLSKEDVAAAEELTDAMNRVWRQVKQVGVVVGAAVAGPLTALFNRSTAIVGTIIEWINNNRSLVQTAAMVAASVLAVAGAITAAGLAATVLAIAVGGIATTIGAIISPVGLLVIGLGALAGWFATTTEAGKTLVSTLTGGLSELGGIASDTVGGIADAMASGDIAAAGEILWAGLKLLWLQGTSVLRTKWAELTTGVVSLWHQSVAGIATLATKAFGSIQAAWSHTVQFVMDAWDLIGAGLMAAFNSLAAFFERVWARITTLVTGGDATEAIERINSELAAANSAISDRTLSGIGAREQAAREQRDANGRATAAMLDGIAQNLEEKLASAGAAETDAIAAQRKRLDEAREKFGELNQAAEAAAEAVKQEAAAKGAQLGLAAAGAAASVGGSSAGAFTAGALRAILGGPDEVGERTASATERTARSVERMERRGESVAETGK